MKSAILLLLTIMGCSCVSQTQPEGATIREKTVSAGMGTVLLSKTKLARIELSRDDLSSVLKYLEDHKLVDDAAYLREIARKSPAEVKHEASAGASDLYTQFFADSVVEEILNAGYAIVTDLRSDTKIANVVRVRMPPSGRPGFTYSFPDGTEFFETDWVYGVF
jgi:hypothetical protein